MDKETMAILRLQDAAQMSERIYHEPLVLTYSGGKDSDVLVHLADAAGIDYEAMYSLTTVDAPQTVKHIRQTFHKLENDGIKCSIDIHRKPEGGGCDDVEFNSQKGVSSPAAIQILLHRIKRSLN